MTTVTTTLPARIGTLKAADVFGEPERLETLLVEIEQAARSIVPDMGTAKGRKSIASVAAKVARSKTVLDGLGKELVAGWKQRAAAVDAQRRTLRARLDDLKAEVRKPLTAWEQAEADRQQAIRRRIEALGAPASGTAAEIAERLAEIEATPIDDRWQELTAEAARAKDAAVTQARAALAEAEAREEAERRRVEAAEKARLEREEQIRREAESKAKQEARAEASRATEQLKQAQEQQRLQQEREVIAAQRRAIEAEERAKQETELAKHRQQEAAERAREEALAEVRREREQKETELQQRRNEAARRAADRAHQAEINREIAAELTLCGLDAEQAHNVVVAIARGRIPHVQINY